MAMNVKRAKRMCTEACRVLDVGIYCTEKLSDKYSFNNTFKEYNSTTISVSYLE